nr:helix-turn-helix transcriptional regulator [uncultured Sphingobacterium sp.]
MTPLSKFGNITSVGFQLFSFRNFVDRTIEQNEQNFFTIMKAFEPIDVRIDAEKYHLTNDQMIFIGPGRYIELSNTNAGKGYAICFTAAFYERSVEDAATINSPLFFGEFPLLYGDASFGEDAFNQLIVDRLSRARMQSDRVFELVAHHCVESLLLDAYHEAAANSKLQLKSATDIGLVNQFSILVHKYCKEYTHVQFYADQLHVTARRLTEACLATTGKTAKSMILAVLVQQAVRYIKHTNLSISQISYEMGFNDESNFRNFVKKQTGHIPRVFRMQ